MVGTARSPRRGFNSNAYRIGWADIARFHNYKIHSSHPALASVTFYSAHIRKNTDRHRQALLLPFDDHKQDRSGLTRVVFSFLGVSSRCVAGIQSLKPEGWLVFFSRRKVSQYKRNTCTACLLEAYTNFSDSSRQTIHFGIVLFSCYYPCCP